MTIKVKYHNPNLPKLEKITQGDWIDLRAAKNYHLENGDKCLIDLGISMQLPEGYEAHLMPRSSTFNKWGIIQTNSVGIIDNSYCGDDDVWMMPVMATRSADIKVGDRICQFRLFENQPQIEFEEVDHLDAESRGGFGSTGHN